MTVYHSAFIAYGAKVTLKDYNTVDDLAVWLQRAGKDLGLGYADGDRAGLVVGDRRFIATYNFTDAELGSLVVTNPPIDVQNRIERAIERGAPIRFASGGVRWWVGGSTW